MKRALAVMAMGCVLLAVAGAQEQAPPGPVAWSVDKDAALEDRLRALDPGDPMGYFELGEEVVSSFPGEAGYELARELYALAYALDEERGGGLDLAASSALATAEITPDPEERRWLLTMARSFVQGSDERREQQSVRRERLQAAEALALHRAGQYGRLRPLLQRIDLPSTLRAAGMSPGDVRTLTDVVERAAANERDEERTDRRTRSDEDMLPHPTNGGNPGPALSSSDFLLSLQAELLLVKGEPGSWAADLVVHRGTPARDLDPGELLTLTGVSAVRARFVMEGAGWRSGRWE